MSNINLNATMNNYEGTVLPILLKFLDKHKNYSANISSVGMELTVTLIHGNKIKRITDKNLCDLSKTLRKLLNHRFL